MAEPVSFNDLIKQDTKKISLLAMYREQGIVPELNLGDLDAIFIGTGVMDYNIEAGIRFLISHVKTIGTYILSDLEFKEDKVIQFADCEVLITKQDGFEFLVKHQEDIGFVILDQAVSNDLFNYLDKLCDGIKIQFTGSFCPDPERMKTYGLRRSKDNRYSIDRAIKSEGYPVRVLELLAQIMHTLQSLNGIKIKTPGRHTLNVYGELVDLEGEHFGDNTLNEIIKIYADIAQIKTEINDADRNKLRESLAQLIQETNTNILANAKNKDVQDFFRRLLEALQNCLNELS